MKALYKFDPRRVNMGMSACKQREAQYGNIRVILEGDVVELVALDKHGEIKTHYAAFRFQSMSDAQNRFSSACELAHGYEPVDAVRVLVSSLNRYGTLVQE